MSRAFKEISLVVLTFIICGVAISSMLQGEMHVNLSASDLSNPAAKKSMIDGLMHYFQGLGAAFLGAGLAYVGIGKSEDLKTGFTTKDGK